MPFTGLCLRASIFASAAVFASSAYGGIIITSQSRTVSIEARTSGGTVPTLFPLQTDTAALDVPFADTLSKTASDTNSPPDTETVSATQNSSFGINSGLFTLSATGSESETGRYTGIADGTSSLSFTFVLDAPAPYSAMGTEITPVTVQDDFVELKLSGPSGNVFDSISDNGTGPSALSQSGILPAGTYTLLANGTAGGGGGSESSSFSLNFSAGSVVAVPLPSASIMGLGLLVPLAGVFPIIRRRLQKI